MANWGKGIDYAHRSKVGPGVEKGWEGGKSGRLTRGRKRILMT
jgi:hypothetical protein